MKKALTLLILSILLLLSPLTNITRAAELEQTQKRVDILPWNGYGVDTNNIAGNNFTKEYEILEQDVNLPNGLYYGPYAESSLFRFERTGGSFEFKSTFNFTYQDIINGCSRFTVRIPIKYDSELYTFAFFNIRDELNNKNILLQEANQTHPYKKDGDNGIYWDVTAVLLPNRDYTFSFKGQLIDNAPIELFLTMEKYQKDETTINFWKIVGADGFVGRFRPEIFKFPQGRPFIYDIYEDLPNIYPAWAFIFEEGIGENGLHGIDLQFGTPRINTTSIFAPFPFKESLVVTANFPGNQTPDAQGLNLSIYLPFNSYDSEEVNWFVYMRVQQDGDPLLSNTTHFKNPNGGGINESIYFWVNNTRDFLLISSPHYLFGDTDIIFIAIFLYPSIDLTVLGTPTYFGTQFGGLSGANDYVYSIETGMGPDNDDSYFREIGLFVVSELTEGIWANITPGLSSIKYDFGWGRGYRFPGSTSVHFFLNNGTNVFIEGNIKNFVNIATGEQEEEDNFTKLMAAIRSIPGRVVGFMRFLWDKLTELGAWIKGLFIGFADWLVSIIGEIKEVLTTMFKAMGISLGFFAILMVQTMATGKAKSTFRQIKMQIGRFKQPIEIAKKSRITRVSKKLEKAEVKTAKAKAKIKRLEAERPKPEIGTERPKEIKRDVAKDVEAAKERRQLRAQRRPRR